MDKIINIAIVVFLAELSIAFGAMVWALIKQLNKR